MRSKSDRAIASVTEAPHSTVGSTVIATCRDRAMTVPFGFLGLRDWLYKANSTVLRPCYHRAVAQMRCLTVLTVPWLEATAQHGQRLGWWKTAVAEAR